MATVTTTEVEDFAQPDNPSPENVVIQVWPEDLEAMNYGRKADILSSTTSYVEFPCELVPPCKRGQHVNRHFLNNEGHITQPRRIGRYFFVEDALKHDLGALKRGELYTKSEFYKRARAWYKAEIDRRIHREIVEFERKWMQDPNQPAMPYQQDQVTVGGNAVDENEAEAEPKQERTEAASPREDSPPIYDDEYEDEPITQEEKKTGKRTRPAKPRPAPTRIQPSRAAKRKVLEAAAERAAKRANRATTPARTKPAAAPEPEAAPATTTTPAANLNTDKGQPNHINPPQKENPTTTITTTPSTNLPPRGPPPETKGDYELSALDWASFNEAERHRPHGEILDPTGIDIAYFGYNLEKAVELKISNLIARREAQAPPGLTIGQMGLGGGLNLLAFYPQPQMECALGEAARVQPPFEPAGVFIKDEDWRPPSSSEPPSSPGPERMWAVADVVRRRSTSPTRRVERVTSAVAAAAPEAEMEISPTLGRWPAAGVTVTEEDGQVMPMEDLRENTVRVSGLEFAVDLCGSTVRGIDFRLKA
ncbi:hypothetical protein B0T22DRAFT_484362 [Podospora appendiculata]|uniref:Uncharacterized protein n=1 Tax=Podospora appendiculata TaxID=314037 RepID=A0AAE0X0F4_9PEZI|nr:hypothetical protein B0T22DRAFT_484362 [Podospora appendiculata]